jgi:ATP-dependent Clp protease ATP-binding subunit ClpA
VGKTELARQLAAFLGIGFPALRHERVHGEATPVAAHRRVPVLRGLRQGGLLTNPCARTRTKAELLLDEIEKATPTWFKSCSR